MMLKMALVDEVGVVTVLHRDVAAAGRVPVRVTFGNDNVRRCRFLGERSGPGGDRGVDFLELEPVEGIRRQRQEVRKLAAGRELEAVGGVVTVDEAALLAVFEQPTAGLEVALDGLPGETLDLSANNSERTAVYRARVQAWAAAQKNRLKSMAAQNDTAL